MRRGGRRLSRSDGGVGRPTADPIAAGGYAGPGPCRCVGPVAQISLYERWRIETRRFPPAVSSLYITRSTSHWSKNEREVTYGIDFGSVPVNVTGDDANDGRNGARRTGVEYVHSDNGKGEPNGGNGNETEEGDLG